MPNNKFRLVTRSDFDGLVCAVLLKDLDLIDDILFVHPKDMQDGKIDITENDITTNLPYVAGCHIAFDHHLSETVRNSSDIKNHIIDPKAPSAARVVYDYYGGADKLPNISVEMMDAVDKGDAAQFSKDEILNPTDWVLMNFIMDARTGLGRFREFKISNYQLMMKLIDACKDQSIESILQMEDVSERVALYNEHNEKAKEQITKCATVHKNLVVLDLTQEAEEEGSPVLNNVNGFIMGVETSKNSVGSLKRRYAVAKNPQGVTILKGEPSFSSSDQILIDELAFYITSNNLKAY